MTATDDTRLTASPGDSREQQSRAKGELAEARGAREPNCSQIDCDTASPGAARGRKAALLRRATALGTSPTGAAPHARLARAS